VDSTEYAQSAVQDTDLTRVLVTHVSKLRAVKLALLMNASLALQDIT
jgi:hypothetical protein